ncbi:hypothetical protein ACP4OV_025621 [Aristida adscensionis]
MRETITLALTLLAATTTMAATAASVSSSQPMAAGAAAGGRPIGLPNCPTRCGTISVPYPFGISPGCSLPDFNLTCDTSHTPPRLLLGNGTLQVMDISLNNSTVRVLGPGMATDDLFWHDEERWTTYSVWDGMKWGLNGDGGTYVMSETHNEFILWGCYIFAELRIYDGGESKLATSCGSVCDNPDDANLQDKAVCRRRRTSTGGHRCKKCSGVGCCRTPVPGGRTYYSVGLNGMHSRTLDFAAFIAEEGWFQEKMSAKTLSNSTWTAVVPTVLAWVIFSSTLPGPNGTRDGNATCPKDLGNTGCHSSYSTCTSIYRHRTKFNSTSYLTYDDPASGYTCKCWDGYQGNPYLPEGCQDIDECALPDKCYGNCRNIPGNYLCECPRGSHGDPYIPNGCLKSHQGLSIGLGVGSGAGFLLLVICSMFLLRKIKSQRKNKLRQRFFKQNRGQLLQQLICQRKDIAERMMITLKELEKATNNFDKTHELGHGGHGMVYKGILSSQHVVAVKKSKITVQSEIDDFINEVAMLSHINHKNIVKLLGCCLETQVPLLVYEFITNGSLHNHLHAEASVSLPWKDRLRIAIETARALTYLHSFVSMPIIHRDVKSANILLNDNLTVKLSDFGSSRHIPIDQTGVDTVVQGTFGYLDPMYCSTGHLTEKSDVYSFGVILIELITRQKPVSYRSTQGYGLVKHFFTLLSKGNLDQILDPQVIREGDEEVIDVAQLAAMCVQFIGDERPTMRQVEMRLETIYATKDFDSSELTHSEEFEENCTWENSSSVSGTNMEAIRIVWQNGASSL